MTQLLKIPRITETFNLNHHVIELGDWEVFQSYDTIIAVRTPGGIYLDKWKWDCSRITGKYRNMFLGIDKKETEARIKDGRFILKELN